MIKLKNNKISFKANGQHDIRGNQKTKTKTKQNKTKKKKKSTKKKKKKTTHTRKQTKIRQTNKITKTKGALQETIELTIHQEVQQNKVTYVSNR